MTEGIRRSAAAGHEARVSARPRSAARRPEIDGLRPAAKPFGKRIHFRVHLEAAQTTPLQVLEHSTYATHVAGFAAITGLAVMLSGPAAATAAGPGGDAANAAGDVDDIAITERVYSAHTIEEADAQPPVDQGGAPVEQASTGGWRDLYLEVFINDQPTNLIGNFKQTPDGDLAVEGQELSDVGLKPVEDARGEDGLYRLALLPGVTYQLDEETQRIYVRTDIEGRSTHIVDVNSAMLEERMTPSAGYGAVLNYSLYATSNSLRDYDDVGILDGISGDFDARVFTPFGTVDQSFLSGYTDGELEGITRLNTTWAYSSVKQLMTYRAGDMVSGGLAWTRPVYMGGFQMQRNFALRSDLVTLPLPSFQGSAAVPSTLEVYSQNAQTYSGAVGEGPFQIDNLPVYAGAGEARVVLRDSLGRETEATLPFYTSSDMLAKGLFDFSLDVGFPRRNYGTESFDYDERVYGVATARYGLTSQLTLEGHTELGENLVNGGVGATFPLLYFGAMSIATAGSYSEGRTGGLANVSVETAYNNWTVYARVQRTFGDYKDIASVTAVPEIANGTGMPIQSPDVPKEIEQVAVGVPMPFDFAALNLSYTHIKDEDGDESRVVGMSYSQPIGKFSLYATAFAELEDDSTYGAYTGVSVPLGENITASTAVEYAPEGLNFTADISKPEGLEDGSYGWRIRDLEGAISQRQASGSYRSPWARFEAGIQQYDKDFRAAAQVDGAFAVAGGDVFASNQIDDAFAVVDVGVPGVVVSYQNRPVGKSNARGKKLVTGLNSYEPATISIDPANLPVDVDIGSTKSIVVPADHSGVVVDFGISEDSKAAIVTLVDVAGQPIEAGSSGQLEGGESFVVGYDGQAYVTGLSGNNTVTVTTGYEKSCVARFDYTPAKGEQVAIGGVVCE